MPGVAMTQGPTPEPVPPQTGLPRTVGVLNIVFGLLLLLWAAGSLYYLGPFLAENTPLQIDPELTQDVVNTMRRDLLEQLRGREQATRDGAEKARLEAAIRELQSVRTDLAGRVDFGTINRQLPWVSRYLWANVVSGPVLNVAMVISGVGLVALKRWGRVLAVVVAALKVVRLVVLCAILSVFVVPGVSGTLGQFAATDFGTVFLRQATAQGNPMLPAQTAASIKPDEFVRAVAATGYLYAVMGLALGAAYPLIVLIVLSRPGAVAACSGARAQYSGVPGELI
jgi:hypothetical protein